MKKTLLIILISILNLNLGLAQTESEIASLLNGIAETENSKKIIKTEQAEKIIALGEKSLPYLAKFFTDTTFTKVKSLCQKRNLTKGEIAIIMADRIDRMPYAILTGVRNCLHEFCKDNTNLIEYYLPWINRDGFSNFKEKYMNWLINEWPKEVKGKARRKRKRIINEWKNSSR